MKLKTKCLHGLHLTDKGFKYSDLVANWFDMGLRSVYGKEKADILKNNNKLTHADIFSKIFNVSKPYYNLYNPLLNKNPFKNDVNVIGLNLTAGNRWPSKSMPKFQIEELIKFLLVDNNLKKYIFVLFGAEEEVKFNVKLVNQFDNSRLTSLDTSSNILDFATALKNLKILISVDTLALHIAISQSIPSIGLFYVTSAAEIGCGEARLIKIINNHPDYCSYKKNGNNTNINTNDIIKSLVEALD